MTLGIIPVIGSAGLYDFAAPFDVMAVEGVEYTCKAIRRISDYLANNEDVRKDIYEVNSLTEEVWEEDVAVDAHIVSLQSRSGHWLYVPVRFILSFPSADGVPYRTVMIGVSLPSLSVSQDLTALEAEVKVLVDGFLGVSSTVKHVETSKAVLITHDEHLMVQQQRAVASIGQTTSAARIHAQQQLINKQAAKIEVLENFIKTNHATP